MSDTRGWPTSYLVDSSSSSRGRDPRRILIVFETRRPFRGIEARGVAELIPGDFADTRAAIAARYLGEGDGCRFCGRENETGRAPSHAFPDVPVPADAALGFAVRVAGAESFDDVAEIEGDERRALGRGQQHGLECRKHSPDRTEHWLEVDPLLVDC